MDWRNAIKKSRFRAVRAFKVYVLFSSDHASRVCQNPAGVLSSVKVAIKHDQEQQLTTIFRNHCSTHSQGSDALRLGVLVTRLVFVGIL